jgi:hypothetical protein
VTLRVCELELGTVSVRSLWAYLECEGDIEKSRNWNVCVQRGVGGVSLPVAYPSCILMSNPFLLCCTVHIYLALSNLRGACVLGLAFSSVVLRERVRGEDMEVDHVGGINRCWSRCINICLQRLSRSCFKIYRLGSANVCLIIHYVYLYCIFLVLL